MDCQSGGRGSPMKRGWMIDCTTKLGAQETTMTISIREGPPINCPSRAGGQAMASRLTAIRTRTFYRSMLRRGVGQAGRPRLARGSDDPVALDVEVVAGPGRAVAQPGTSGLRDTGGAAAVGQCLGNQHRIRRGCRSCVRSFTVASVMKLSWFRPRPPVEPATLD